MKHSLRLQTLGGFGFPDPPALCFDLSQSALFDNAKRRGVARFGAPPGPNRPDTRPVAPLYRHGYNAAWNTATSWGRLQGGEAATRSLTQVNSAQGGAAGLFFTDPAVNNPHAFALESVLEANAPLAFRGFVYDIGRQQTSGGAAADSQGHCWHVRLGGAGQGTLFQIRDGRPEIAQLAPGWNREQENALRSLWALDAPTSAQEAQIETLIEGLYSTFRRLSLEAGTGRDQWRAAEFFVTLLAEPRGVVHLVLEGGEAFPVEFEALTALTKPTPLWKGDLEVGATGGAWMFQPLPVTFGSGQTIDYGPWWEGTDSAALGELQTSAVVVAQDEAASVTLEPLTYGQTGYGFRATFNTTNPHYGAWLYGLSARFENGPRTGLQATEVTFDTDHLPAPPSELAPDANVVLESRLRCDEEGRRTALVTMRDVAGRLGKTLDDLVGRMANLHCGQGRDRAAAQAARLPCLTQALVARGRTLDARAFALQFGDELLRAGFYIAKNETLHEVTLADGRALLDESYTYLPLILDGLTLGEAFRRLLRVVGYSEAEMALVPADLGPRLPQAKPGEAWAVVLDEGRSVGQMIGDLLDRWGLGLRFHQNADGVFVLEPLPTSVVAEFVSGGAQSDPDLLRGGSRFVIGNGLNWERDPEHYFNIFRVVGGVRGDIVRDWVDHASMRTLGGGGVSLQPRYLGREKRFPVLRDPGLRTLGDVIYAYRSLADRYGRPGRRATFETYFVRQFVPRDRVRCDGVLCEVLRWEASAARDRMQIQVQEVA